jgi:hypothetical protein
MPKTGRKTAAHRHDDLTRKADKRRRKRFQDRFHKVVRQQREALREQFPGRKPPEWIVRHSAYLKICRDGQGEPGSQ